MRLQALCGSCGDVPVAAPATVVVARPRPALWHCCFICPQCHRGTATSIVESAGYVLISAGAYVFQPGRTMRNGPESAGTPIDLDDIEAFRTVVRTEGLLESLAERLPD